MNYPWNEKSYYNLRKRFGKDRARKIIDYWLHFHIESPSDSEEALEYYLGVLE